MVVGKEGRQKYSLDTASGAFKPRRVKNHLT